MISQTVILLLCLSMTQDVINGFRMYKYSRSVDSSQFSPQTPCPSVFQYSNDETGTLMGTIKVDRANHGGRVQLDVELSLGNSVQGYNGKITLAEDRNKVINDIMSRKPIYYKVHFPAWQNFPPRITKILVNGDQICSGPRIPIQMVPVLTTINLQHKLSLDITPLISSSDPTVDSSSNFNNLAPIFNTQGKSRRAKEKGKDRDQKVFISDFSENPFLNGQIDLNSGKSRRAKEKGKDRDQKVFISDFSENPFLNGQIDLNSAKPSSPIPPSKSISNNTITDILNKNVFLNGQVNVTGNQPSNTQYPFDIRVDNIPTVPNNIFTNNFNPGGRPDNAANNPYNFNPPPRPPPPDRRPPPPTPDDAFSQNPFLVGLSTPQPNRGNEEDIQINNFFDTRTSESPQVLVPHTTRTPPRNGNPSVNEICGRPIATNSLIFNGQGVPRGAYPWLVAIFRQLENLSLSYICSASLISERHIVTAAHCVKMDYRRLKPSEVICVFGKLNIRKWATVDGERILEPEAIVVHPDYQAGKANADIAIMSFQDPIPFSKMIRPVCLWQGPSDLNQVVGNIGTVVGWGRNENGDVTTAEPRQVNMPIVDQFQCLQGKNSTTTGHAFLEIVSENTFCAGFRNGSGPCNGDSGSGFVLKKSGVYFLRGIVSTALSEVSQRTCNLQEYVVFTDASKYLDWILTTLRKT